MNIRIKARSNGFWLDDKNERRRGGLTSRNVPKSAGSRRKSTTSAPRNEMLVECSFVFFRTIFASQYILYYNLQITCYIFQKILKNCQQKQGYHNPEQKTLTAVIVIVERASQISIARQNAADTFFFCLPREKNVPETPRGHGSSATCNIAHSLLTSQVNG